MTWSDDGICSAVGIIIGDFDINTLTSTQALRISVLINSIFAPYPVHLKRSVQRTNCKTVLKSYIDGQYLDVAALRGHDPTLHERSTPDSTAADETPAAPPPSYAVTPPPHDNIFSSLADKEPVQDTYTPQASSSVRYMAQFYTAARQHGGRDDESLARARTTSFKTCDAFAVPPKLRANYVQISVKQTEHNLPALIRDLDGFSADNIWDAIANRVTSTARDLRIRKLRKIASLATEPHIAGDTEVTRRPPC
ncbi:hypothetical protein I4F81_009114 [Pyropia yezoensis]|uniref:Uncharacterized protein n=1 Tax=Pyropia yezoensis TaxID=2788 RepID=A0ACC3C9Z9_PYRYE|nr:hypothetical protein I4F81_009114 [Neopyropia yezoensis]